MHPLQEKPTLAQLETTFSLRNEEISDSSSNLTLQKAAAEGPQEEVGREAPSLKPWLSVPHGFADGFWGNHSAGYRALALKSPVPEVLLSWSQISSET